MLKEHICDEEFYYLCKTYIDISLNAPKLPDIDKTKEATTNFINTFNIQNIEELLEVIKMFSPYASNYNRQKSGTLFKDVPYGSPTIGRYFDFCRMPDEVWKTIVQDILNNK